MWMFQSQTRSRPSCHGACPARRNTAFPAVSISNEKPPQLPRCKTGPFSGSAYQFQSQTRSRPSCHVPIALYLPLTMQVSISNEKPPQLPLILYPLNSGSAHMFQSQTRSRPSCHLPALADSFDKPEFQSQTRSRPSCHFTIPMFYLLDCEVSISNEKPPQLPHPLSQRTYPVRLCFNLKREAAPVATWRRTQGAFRLPRFQSQTRSRPSCHGERRFCVLLRQRVSISNEKPPQLPRCPPRNGAGAAYGVSISNEKPPQLPRRCFLTVLLACILFQSQTRSRPSCHYAARHYSTFALKFQSQTRSRPSCHSN